MNLPDGQQVDALYDLLMAKIDPDLTSKNLPKFREKLAKLNQHEQDRIMNKKGESFKKYEEALAALSVDYKDYLREYYVGFLKDAETHYNEHQLREILKKLDEELKNL